MDLLLRIQFKGSDTKDLLYIICFKGSVMKDMI